MTTLSTNPYKGTRDFYPEDKRLQNYIFDKWRDMALLYGYEEYLPPLMEPIEIYAAKSGQELVEEQTYVMTDRAGRKMAIRPEMTPSVSRLVAARAQQLAYPARLFSIANFMRYERPQRGREREFWQFNLDIFGAEGSEAEAEVIQMGYKLLRSFGADEDMFIIKISSRALLGPMMHDYLNLDAAQAERMTKLLDRRAKMPLDEFESQAGDIFGASNKDEGLRKILALIEVHSVASLPDLLRKSAAADELAGLFGALDRMGIHNAVLDVTLMRGLDYYTGTVFEFFDTDISNRRSLFGGGRYDGLVGLFGAEPISAVGMAPGYSMTELFLQTHDLLPRLTTATELAVASVGDVVADVEILVDKLRGMNLRTEFDFTNRRLDKKLRSAAKKGIPFVLIVGENELQSGIFTVRDMRKGSEDKLPFESIAGVVRARPESGTRAMLSDQR